MRTLCQLLGIHVITQLTSLLSFYCFRIFVLYLFNLGVLTYSLYTLSQNCGEVLMVINRSFAMNFCLIIGLLLGNCDWSAVVSTCLLWAFCGVCQCASSRCPEKSSGEIREDQSVLRLGMIMWSSVWWYMYAWWHHRWIWSM